ncbi:DNA mismatch repair protein Mlh3 [Solea solea]|uniref:DNA mismatch repair protein Mlh3 n=1 Tax=Solea solea TaxID=90069 RepID=UPI00272A39EC|nr:DNA mismatch repair protein Mlh3 [Solea solea]
MIKCLPIDVQGKLRSGVAVPSLQQCVEELVLNSIDAGATCVGVRVDMESLKVQVIDNGAGMSDEDMDCVGNRYYTSKCSSLEDLDNLRWYGYRGEALASILSVASLVEISSRTRSSVKTHVKMFKNGKGMAVFEAEAVRPSAGTTVVICSFFHNMPVRRGRVDAVLEVERIRHRVEAISLMHPSVSFTLRNDCTGAMMVQLSKANNTYHRFVQIHSSERAKKLGEIAFAQRHFEVTGYICREGHYNSSLQFLYVNSRLLLKTRIHKLLNFLLRRLSSSNQKSDSPDGQSGLRSPKHKRNQELHGVYIINIKCPYSEYDICLDPTKTLIEFKDWDGVLFCIEEAVKDFLRRENLLDDLDSSSQEEDKSGNGEQARGSMLDCNAGITLASESVHRALKDVCVSEDSVCHESGPKLCKGVEAEKIQNDGYAHKDCRDVQLEPASEEETFNKAEGSSSVRPQESELKETLNNTASTSNVTLPGDITGEMENQPDVYSNKPVLPDCQDAGGHKKISLSDPFIHEKLYESLTPSLSRINKPVFLQQNLTQKAVERSSSSSSSSKSNISLDSDQDRCNNFVPVIPPKIPRIESCRRLSLWKESGSLDKFRRIFAKSDEKKLPSLETCLQNSTRLPQTNSLIFHPRNPLEDQHDGNVTQTQRSELLSSFQDPVFRAQKDSSTKSRQSLAAKICHLKRHRPVGSNMLPGVYETTSQDNICLESSGHDIQDSNNNGNLCDTALHHKPVSGCNTSLQISEEGEDTSSDDWIHHFDASVGKTVYVNRVTGLSKYKEPSTEETHVRCTSDVTNMAVSVVSETGMEYRCYPFQMDIVLPFLPKSRTERVISSGLDGKDDGEESSNSLSSLYSKWNNPVFVRPPMVGVDISSGQADGLAVKIHNILFPYRFSKAMIKSMKVICQVDKKFLACLINTRDEEPAVHNESEGNLLVLVDQHAAHERVRLENLVADSYEEAPNASGERRLRSSNILPPLEISVTEEEQRLLRSCQAHLENLGLELKYSQAADPQVFVGKVPLCFMERENNELKRGRPSVIKGIVEEYLREQTELLRSAGRVRGTLPLTVLKVLASLACHGAIKFNHSLSRDECHSLVASLSSCQLPFQCAHGRPSIIPLVDVLHLDKEQQKEPQKPNLQKLRRMHKAWELYGNR